MSKLKIEDLKCCGNCDNRSKSFCKQAYIKDFDAHKVCNRWKFDQIEFEERFLDKRV